VSAVPPLVIKLIVILILLVIVGSLVSALVFLYKDHGNGTRVARALTVRVALSITLFCLLMAGFYFGIIPPQGLR
jgi:hypothetical protein